jgi:hypothetical protein
MVKPVLGVPQIEAEAGAVLEAFDAFEPRSVSGAIELAFHQEALVDELPSRLGQVVEPDV